MKYYIVALFDEDSYESLTPIQRNLSKKFRANRNSPIPHITLEVLDNPNTEKLNVVVEKILHPYKYFKVELCDNVSISESMRTLNLEIEDKGYIKRLSRLLTDTLSLYGFNLRPKEDSMAIALANMNYIPKEPKKSDNEYAIDLLKRDFKKSTLKVNRLELWKISNNKKETVIKTYNLKSF